MYKLTEEGGEKSKRSGDDSNKTLGETGGE